MYKTIEKAHGRIEMREVRVIDDLEWLPQRTSWKKLTTLIEVKATREHIKSGKCESATRLYICSRQGKAADFSQWVRGHWGVENSCHWQVDVIFGEDAVQMDVFLMKTPWTLPLNLF